MNNRTLNIANQLALKFTDDGNIPSRFKNDKTKKERQKSNLNSLIEQRFQKKVSDWQSLINTMLDKIDNEQQAWRFLLINPIVEKDIKSAAYSKDFGNFIDYLVLRRDKENCESDELGLLAMLHAEFQREIERQIEKEE